MKKPNWKKERKSMKKKYNENFLFAVHTHATILHQIAQQGPIANGLMVKWFDLFLKFMVKIFNKNS